MDYDKLAELWTEREKGYVHMDRDALRSRIDDFIRAHNTGALATASEDLVRCTPIEYNFVNGYIYLFSEGGMKFRALKDNKKIGFSIFEPFEGFNKVKGLQITGRAEMIEPFCDEYLQVMEYKHIPLEAMKKLPNFLNLIKIVPDCFDLLDSDLTKEGFGNRQHLDVI